MPLERPGVECAELTLGAVHTRALSVRGAGPPILLLHGFSDSADTWRGVLSALACRNRAAIAVDLPGHGVAAAMSSGPILPQLCAFAADLADRYPGSVLAGNSLGGLAALLAAQHAHSTVRGVAAIGPAGLGYQPWFWRMRSLAGPMIFAGGSLPAPAARALIGHGYSRLSCSSRPPEEVLELYTSHLASPQRIRALASMVRRLGREGAPGCFAVEDTGVPLLLLWGAHDRLVPPASAKLVHLHRPDARLVVLDGCGHCPQVEAPAAVAEHLEAFAQAVGAPTPRTASSSSSASPM